MPEQVFIDAWTGLAMGASFSETDLSRDQKIMRCLMS